MIHQLKCEAKYFEELCSGAKTFEVRKNDRDFHVGDYLALNELTPHICNDEKKRNRKKRLIPCSLSARRPKVCKRRICDYGH